ncbi:prepilin-type cleavage/methylation N-terminal domain protein [Jonquetella anthropi E3_33 E1]|nr:prepilin-type cleavage/methylation N-terminal domain protein [Jonquetella anthropi E3_33 E1]
MRSTRRRRRAFSLVETLVCLAVISVAAALSVAFRPNDGRLRQETELLADWVRGQMVQSDRLLAGCSFRLAGGEATARLTARFAGRPGEETFFPRPPVRLLLPSGTGAVWRWSYQPLVHTLTPAVRWQLADGKSRGTVIVSGRGAVRTSFD